jgi:hypothetical protein
MLKVSTVDIRALGGQFSELADELKRAPAAAAPSGPSWQPSLTALGDVSRSIDHVDGECARALTDFGDKLNNAAAAYESSDAASGASIAQAMPSR